MWLYLTIVILFTYTLLLIVFFMGWCTLIPNRCHSRKDLPFSTVKSPRRNTKFAEIDSISSSASLDMYKLLPAVKNFEKLSKESEIKWGKKNSIASSNSSGYTPRNDYLHPKYSLPPIDLGLEERKWEFEQLLRTPAKPNKMTSSNPDGIQKICDNEDNQKILAEIVEGPI
ncbi:hypothetical protein WR25_04827 [Diploscapter pachys]|uniref:Uncharacterized protein n=1 Tax=Diploscapter pachys TaxID=2018661 RepID=A0A2A2J6Y1_9BILA|nr:hypothetical protein WR25_04827 [Diploscapter pachys]